MGARFPSSLFSAAKREGVNIAWSSMFVVFIVLQFGWSESPSEYGVYGWAISMNHRSLGPVLICQLPTLAFTNLVFVDDAAIVEPGLFGRAEASCVAYNWSLFQLLGLSLNLKKLLVDGMLALCHIFWGITYHLEKAALGVQFVWVELTRSTKLKAAAFMRLKHAQPGERAVLLVDHQRLVGNVQWWSVCAPAFRGLLGSLYHMSRSESSTWVSPVGTAEEKELAWQEYDGVKTLLAMLVEMGGEEPSGIGRFERFQDRSDDEVQAMIQAELIDVHVPGLTFEPLTKLLDFFTSGDSVLSSFALPDGPVDHITSKYSISESMGSEPDEWSQSAMTESEALEAGRVGFGGVCSGIESLELAHRKKGAPTSFFMELDQMKFNFLDSAHPKFVHKCMDVLGEEYRSWFFPSPLTLPRIVGGGPPCVFAAWPGRRRGMRDNRSKPFTHGLAKVVKSLDANRPSTVWSVIVANVAGVAWVDDGEALVVMLKGFYELGLTLTPRPEGGVKNIQVVCARALGGRAVRPRLMGYLEKRWMVHWLGHALPIECPKALPSALSEILEPDEAVALCLIVPDRFTPLPGTKLDDRGIKLAGHIDYGGPEDPVVRGSLVRLDDSESNSWRVMRVRGFQYDLMKADRDDPVYRKGVEPSSISMHLRERRRVNHPDGGAGIITKFGEPGLVGGSGHLLVLRGIGVSWLTARELWRL